MRFLFVVQGEGRGHMTQALALSDMLMRNGHQVAEALVGYNKMRQIPDFFFDGIHAPVQTFSSPNFLKTTDHKHFRIFRSFVYNLKKEQRKSYFSGIRFIRKRIEEVEPDVVVNFYELLCGLAYRHYKIRTPMVCIAHQFVFEHPAYAFSRRLRLVHHMLRWYTRLSASNARKRLALSFYPMADEPSKNLFVVPPLLRREILNMQPASEPFLAGYILNHGFADEIIAWHKKHPEAMIHVFWDKPTAPEAYMPHDNLYFHRLDDELFIRMTAQCAGYFGTSGFESICEAGYFGKPILAVPAHAEQELNADDAQRTGFVQVAPSFDLDKLTELISRFDRNNADFKNRVNRAEEIILEQLTTII